MGRVCGVGEGGGSRGGRALGATSWGVPGPRARRPCTAHEPPTARPPARPAARDESEQLRHSNATRRVRNERAAALLSAARHEAVANHFPTLLRYQSLTLSHVGAMLLREQRQKLRQLLDVLPLRVTGVSAGTGGQGAPQPGGQGQPGAGAAAAGTSSSSAGAGGRSATGAEPGRAGGQMPGTGQGQRGSNLGAGLGAGLVPGGQGPGQGQDLGWQGQGDTARGHGAAAAAANAAAVAQTTNAIAVGEALMVMGWRGGWQGPPDHQAHTCHSGRSPTLPYNHLVNSFRISPPPHRSRSVACAFPTRQTSPQPTRSEAGCVSP
jgi:hypothetical protein